MNVAAIEVGNMAGLNEDALPLMSAKELNTEAKSLSEFRTLVKKYQREGWSPNGSKWTDGNGITFKGERMVHVDKRHVLTDEQLDDLEANIGELYHAAISIRKSRGSLREHKSSR